MSAGGAGRSGPANGRRQGRHGHDPRPNASGGKGGMDQKASQEAQYARQRQNNPGMGGPRPFGPGPFNTFDRRSQMNVFPGHTTGGQWGWKARAHVR